MKWANLALLLLFVSASAAAENGILIHLRIKNLMIDGPPDVEHTLLMRLNDKTTIRFPDRYDLHLQTLDVGKHEVNISATLKGLSDVEPFAGSGNEKNTPVGSAQTMPIRNDRGITLHWSIDLDTSYATLPEGARP